MSFSLIVPIKTFEGLTQEKIVAYCEALEQHYKQEDIAGLHIEKSIQPNSIQFTVSDHYHIRTINIQYSVDSGILSISTPSGNRLVDAHFHLEGCFLFIPKTAFAEVLKQTEKTITSYILVKGGSYLYLDLESIQTFDRFGMFIFGVRSLAEQRWDLDRQETLNEFIYRLGLYRDKGIEQMLRSPFMASIPMRDIMGVIEKEYPGLGDEVLELQKLTYQQSIDREQLDLSHRVQRAQVIYTTLPVLNEVSELVKPHEKVLQGIAKTIFESNGELVIPKICVYHADRKIINEHLNHLENKTHESREDEINQEI